MKYPGFLGPTNQQQSRFDDVERTVNLIIKVADAGMPTARAVAYKRPGLRILTRVGNGPIRWIWGQDDRAFFVSGTGFYELFSDWTAVLRGVLTSDAYPATGDSNGTNGNQLALTSGGVGYIYDLVANDLVAISAPGFPLPVKMIVFVDTYFLALKTAANQFQWSTPLNGLLWPGLNVAQTTLSSDQKLAIAVSHRSVFVFGSKYTEVWNSNVTEPAFAPIDNTFIEHGVEAPFSVCNLDNTLYWVGRDTNGGALVWRLDGFTPVKVSTWAVDTALTSSSQLQKSIAFSFQLEGHAYYLIYAPDLPTTWVYDVSVGLWYEWSTWNPALMRHEPYLGRCHAFIFGTHVVGDRQSGALYQVTKEALDDDAVIP